MPASYGYAYEMSTEPSNSRLTFAVALLCVGMPSFVLSMYLETRNPRSEAEDNLAWQLFTLGMFLVGTGASLPFMRAGWAMVVGALSPGVAFALLVVLVWCNAFG